MCTNPQDCEVSKARFSPSVEWAGISVVCGKKTPGIKGMMEALSKYTSPCPQLHRFFIDQKIEHLENGDFILFQGLVPYIQKTFRYC